MVWFPFFSAFFLEMAPLPCLVLLFSMLLLQLLSAAESSLTLAQPGNGRRGREGGGQTEWAWGISPTLLLLLIETA